MINLFLPRLSWPRFCVTLQEIQELYVSTPNDLTANYLCNCMATIRSTEISLVIVFGVTLHITQICPFSPSGWLGGMTSLRDYLF